MKPTNRKRKRNAVKEEATRLHSKLVRRLKGPWCQNSCGRPVTDCAHIIGRTYSNTRTDLANAYALCAQCHRRFGSFHDEWMDFIEETIGMGEYERLKRKALDGVGVKFDWFAELDRLRALASEVEEDVA